MIGFSKTLNAAKKNDAQYFAKGVTEITGAQLALRALGWGSLLAFLGTGSLCFGVYKLSGAQSVRLFIFKLMNAHNIQFLLSSL